MIIEWNVHMFSSDTRRFQFHPMANYVPGADRLSKDPLKDYIAHMDTMGIDRSVLVHPEPYGDDHSLVKECVSRDRNRFRMTSLFYPRDPEAPAKLQALAEEDPGLVSTRFHKYHASNLTLSADSPGKERQYLDRLTDSNVLALWGKAAALGLIVELHINPTAAQEAGEAISQFSDTPVIIDHLAEPQEGTGPDFAEILELSRFSNVYMKLSALDHFADDAPLYRSAMPFTGWVLKAFGSDRMIWGAAHLR